MSSVSETYPITPDGVSHLEEHEALEGEVTYRLIPKPNDEPHHPLFEQYDAIRVEWVQNIYKWLPALHTDTDRYDIDNATGIVGVTRQKGHEEVLLGALRLTPIDNLDQALSWDMVKIIFKERAYEAEVSLLSLSNGVFAEALREGRVYDVTRAFPNPNHFDDAEETMLRMFGAGKGYCDMQQGKEVTPGNYYWMFTLNKTLSAFLEKHDIPFVEIAEDTENPNVWMRTRVVVVNMLESYRHVSEETPEHPSHKIIVEAAEEAIQKLIV